MSKTITSPVKKWAGTVTLADPLTFPQAMAFEAALAEVQALNRDTASLTEANLKMVSGLLPCVERWSLDGGFPAEPTVETFPVTPRLSSARLIAWLTDEIAGLYGEGEEIPNE